MSKNTIISYNVKGSPYSDTLGDFELNQNPESPLYKQTQKTNKIAQTIYENINPKYWEKHVSVWDKFLIFIFNILSASLLTSKIQGIVTNYLGCEKENELPLLKENIDSFYPSNPLGSQQKKAQAQIDSLEDRFFSKNYYPKANL